MSIPIYKYELRDGLEEVLRATSSIAYSSPLRSHTPSEGEEEKAKLVALNSFAENKEQFDLYYLTSVLVSTGWNKNDDIFDIEETWVARNTPEDKQFNFMHDETDIIGHITGNFVLDSNGQKVHEIVGTKNLPEQFDIITSAVLYNSWSDPKLKERMAKIISEIEEDKWFVSMECLFAGFDYGVITPDGQHKTIARSEESSFLTKHLRSYGGTGEYEGHQLGRLLRSISFSGKGLVSNPANPRSFIINDTSLFKKNNETYSITQSNIRENFNMANEDIQLLQKQNDELRAALNQAKSDEEALKSAISAKKDEEVQAKVEAFEASIVEKDEAIAKLQEDAKAFEDKVQEIEELLAKKDEELTEANSKIEAHETAIKLEARKTALVEAGFDEADIEKALETFADVSDEMFDEIVNLTAKKGNPFEKKDDEEEDEEDAGYMKKKAETETEASDETDETVDEAEADVDVEALDNAEEDTDAALADAGNDEIDTARTSASSWLEKHVLHTTASIDEE